MFVSLCRFDERAELVQVVRPEQGQTACLRLFEVQHLENAGLCSSGNYRIFAALRGQFGQEYQGKEADKDFKKKFLIALRAVLAVYPQAKVKQVTGGLMLMASPPPIPYKGP
jgi:hypothetical protein